ncbi:MAG: Lrp/AsnC family transcriptional regulator [Intrasporangium sp.]|uniref:Lrp/AsnC family transcriptional regulator n=1 Tax=Intrasporangium sp. TaxID=1925024 RepID=UPI002647CAA8|nr:Lrp/AsnC family transcriptional regulator [Intrasporangium sp.]MDN5795414.1 Lrp/AsnC family transcriptional regulator [Intrasporangium sp.]
MRLLEQRGVIRGYCAEIDPDVTGASAHALIQVRVQGNRRDQVTRLSETFRHIPGVQQVFLIGGDKDLMLHVACASVPALRDLISEHLWGLQAV